MRLTRRTMLVAATLAIAAILVALAVWLWRRRGSREGWEYENKVGLSEMSPAHKLQIQRWCLEGRKSGRLTREDSFAHLQKYSRADVAAVCEPKRQEWLKRAAQGWTDEAVIDKDAKGGGCQGGRVCSVPALRVTHPCGNANGDKCCLYQRDWNKKGSVQYLQNCVLKGGYTNNAVKGPVGRGDKNVDQTTDGTYEGKEVKKWACVKDGQAVRVYNMRGPFTSTESSQQKKVTEWCNAKKECDGKCVGTRYMAGR